MFLCFEVSNQWTPWSCKEKGNIYSGMKILRQCDSKTLNHSLNNVKCYSSPDCSFEKFSFLNQNSAQTAPKNDLLFLLDKEMRIRNQMNAGRLQGQVCLTLKKNWQLDWTRTAELPLNHPSKDPSRCSHYILNNLDLGKCKDGEVQGSGGLSWKSHYDKANHRGSRHSSFNYPTRGQKNSRASILHPDTMMLRLVAQSCPTLCDPMDCSPPGSSVHGILQSRILG